MSMQLRYKGGFYSLNNTLYEIEIYQEGYSGDVTDIAFCSDPLVIEWPEVDKIEPVQSSNATLQLYCDSDRQFVDLYTIEAGSVRMDVYRDGELYWSGTLDPELYEEPFAYMNNYGVELTFADVAILDRLSWDKTGFITLRNVIIEVLKQSGIQYREIETYISTMLSEGDTSNLLDAICINSANFYDEDGEALSLREVLDETLRPFSLRLIQKNGRVYIYDLNAIYTAFKQDLILWDSNDSILGVDKVYNNVKLTFSPYEETELIKGNVDSTSIPEYNKETIYVDKTNLATDAIGFNIYWSDTGKGLEKSDSAKFFKIDPTYSGQEETGIAWTVKSWVVLGSYYSHLQDVSAEIGSMLFKTTEQPFLFNVGDNKSNYKLKLNLQLLFDVRYNPFEEAGDYNEEKDWENLKNWCNFAYVPFLLTLRDTDGTALCHWHNTTVKDSTSYIRTGCQWETGEGSWGDAWLCWYQGNRKNETGLGGWQSNKQIIGYYRGEKLPVLFDKMDNAEYIDLPDLSGYLELQIGTGVPCYDYGDDDSWKLREDVYEIVRWLLYKNPTLEIVTKTGKSINTKDIQHSAWLNRAAKETLEIDTIIGTLEKASPTARGQLFRVSDKGVQNTFYRAGVTDQIERLLIGTVYSNYATRHNTLAGTVQLLDKFGIYTDNHEVGTYLLLSETQNIYNDESNILMAQFDADNYEGIEYTNE